MRLLVKKDYIAVFAIGVFLASMLAQAALADNAKAAYDGKDEPYLASASDPGRTDNGMLYDESSIVKGKGDVSIRGSFSDRAADSSSWLKGNGSINFESKRSMSKSRAVVDFNQKSDLVFVGPLISIKNLWAPFFFHRNGASISEWSNLSHVDKSETDIIRSINRLNNTLVFDTALAFDGIWNIENQIGSGFGMKKGVERYSGSFQTQKKIELSESGKD